MAVLLMLCAPLLSRWGQSRDNGIAAALSALCSNRSMDVIPSHALPTSHPLAGAGAGDGEHGMADEAACDYCLLAARLLPWLAALVLLLPLLRSAAASPAGRRPSSRSLVWRAHAARAPPLFS
ncbi:DUF2946 family protein [Xanthomonas sp.]|uniref:DUF2946 family protein n=1 Tax=Xanthomonas sp. TaxID=29446 RepID=UPI0031BB5C24